MILHTLLATYPGTRALKERLLRSPLVDFEFADVRVANTAFKALVRDHAFDVGELALITFLQARAHGSPYALLPAVIVGRHQHHTIRYDATRCRLHPGDLAGRRVGVRAYTQTTGAWVRGILEEDYGVDVTRVRWITFEDPHVAAYRDPPWVERAPAGAELLPMLLGGDLDAAIFGNELPNPALTPLIPDPDANAERWAERHGGAPINHMLVVRRSLVESRPDVVREVYRLLLESRHAAVGSGAAHIRFGVEPNRRSLELLVDYAVRQQLIPRRVSVDELFHETGQLLAAA